MQHAMQVRFFRSCPCGGAIRAILPAQLDIKQPLHLIFPDLTAVLLVPLTCIVFTPCAGRPPASSPGQDVAGQAVAAQSRLGILKLLG
jgi:hypothetical protein